MGFPFNLSPLHIQASIPLLLLWRRSPRAPSVGGVLHTGALRSALGWWCRRQCRSSTAILLADGLSPALRAGDSSSSKLCSSSFPKTPNYAKSKHNNLLTSCSSSDSFDQSSTSVMESLWEVGGAGLSGLHIGDEYGTGILLEYLDDPRHRYQRHKTSGPRKS